MSFLNGLFGRTSLEPMDTRIYDDAAALFNSAAAQNETADGEEKAKISSGSACDALPGATGPFGSKYNTVPVNGLFGAWAYMSRLRSLRTGNAVFFHLAVRHDGEALFEVISRSGNEVFDLWFSLYHPRQSRNVPDGYILEKEAVFPRGITTTAADFPAALYGKIKKETKRRLHVEVADKNSKYIDVERAQENLRSLRSERDEL